MAKGGKHWFYTLLYAQQDRANLNHSELAGFRELAKHYATMTNEKMMALIKNRELVEICHGGKE